jgi:ribose 5-phosphate isomerase B
LRIALGSDERSHLTDSVEAELRRRGHDLRLFGPLEGDAQPWPDVALAVAEEVATGSVDEGILFCWTGTGVSIAANKVPGVRAALCADAETARGARAWNQANVLCMSLRGTSEVIAKEILDSWFDTSADPSEAANVSKVNAIDERYRAGREKPVEGEKARTLSGG